MGKQKISINRLQDGRFQVQKDNADGKTLSVELFKPEALDTIEQLAKGLGAVARTHGAIRQHFWSLCHSVLSSQRMAGFKGKGDLTTGKVPKEAKAAWRDAESAIFESLRPLWGKMAADEAGYQAVCATIREDKNYGGLRTLATKLWVFVGTAIADSEGQCIPVPVAQAMVADALSGIQTDSQSYVGKLAFLVQDWEEESKTLTAEDLAAVIAHAEVLAVKAKTLREQLAVMATQTRTGAKIAAEQVIAKAAATVEPALV